MLVAGLLGFKAYNKQNHGSVYNSVTHPDVKSIIEKRIKQLTEKESSKQKSYTSLYDFKPILNKTAVNISSDFEDLKSRYRNTYEFIAPNLYAKHKVHVEPTAGISFDTLQIQNSFGFKYPLINLVDKSNYKNSFNHSIYYFNTQPVGFKILNQEIAGDTIKASIKYTNFLRTVTVSLNYGAFTSYYKKKHYRLSGLPATEDLKIVKIANKWVVLKD